MHFPQLSLSLFFFVFFFFFFFFFFLPFFSAFIYCHLLTLPPRVNHFHQTCEHTFHDYTTLHHMTSPNLAISLKFIAFFRILMAL